MEIYYMLLEMCHLLLTLKKIFVTDVHVVFNILPCTADFTRVDRPTALLEV